ncbi:MAG: (S)-ureidoglycine aminohydrolase [Eubacteriales bacterium]|nr:(S)-ureidoglycine aminohydrolase [Eubacteriales bacterium]
MSYLNRHTGYPQDLLSTRSVIKKNNYCLIEPDGIVKNTVPGYHNCDVTILGSPELGASFVDYLVTLHEGGYNDGIGGEGLEVFLYVLRGSVEAKIGNEAFALKEGWYIFAPESQLISFTGQADSQLFVYKRRYDRLEGYEAERVVGNVNDLEWVDYEGMTHCQIKDLLPAANNLGFDMNFHILRFAPGASHGYIETHIQEHGMYFLSGKAMYRLDDDWVPVKKGDYVFLDAYCPQACYGVGNEEDLTYLYSKDCNRDAKI